MLEIKRRAEATGSFVACGTRANPADVETRPVRVRLGK